MIKCVCMDTSIRLALLTKIRLVKVNNEAKVVPQTKVFHEKQHSEIAKAMSTHIIQTLIQLISMKSLSRPNASTSSICAGNNNAAQKVGRVSLKEIGIRHLKTL